MCDCETICLNSLLHRLSRLSDNEVSLNRQNASSYGMLGYWSAPFTVSNYHEFPALFTDTSEHIRFYFLVFLFSTF